MNIRECDFLCPGPPNWYIKGIFLRLIATDVPWKKLKEAYDGDLKKEIIPQLLEDKDDPESPNVIFEENAYFIQQSLSPNPFLKLKDKYGAFADLWMEYGPDRSVSFHEMGAAGFKRGAEQEKSWEKDLLETDFIPKLLPSSRYYCPMDKVGKSLSFLLELGWKIYDWKENRILHSTQMDFHLDSSQQRIQLRGKVCYEEHEVCLTDVAGAFNRREQFVQIAPGTVGLLPASWPQADFTDLLAEGEIVSDSLSFKQNQIGALSHFFENTSPRLRLSHSFKELKARLLTFDGKQEMPPGETFQGTLRPYQQQGLNWLASLHGLGLHGMLADDMGLGKTVQVIAFLSRLNWTQPVLIVLPTSLIFNWKKEIEAFLPAVPVLVYHGPERSKTEDFSAWKGVILTSYTILRNDIERFLPVDYECVILDEAQVIKNPSTQVAKTVFQLRASFRLSLTGTPIENHLLEMWSHFHFLMPEMLGDEKDFAQEVSAGSSDPRFLARIKRKIRPFLLRRKKEEVAKDLPEKIEQTVWIEMEPGQRSLYEAFLSGIKSSVLKKVEGEGIGKHRMELLESILRLRQICCHPLLAASQITSHESMESAKLEALLDDLETVLREKRKALAHSQFTSMLSLIAKAMKERNWNFVYLDGHTAHRENVVEQFQTDSDTQFFLISLKAGGVGLNLTAADYVFLFDPWWNNAAENQAIDRAHRIGRKGTVIAKRYVTVETIEEKMMKLKAMKNTLLENIVDDHFAETRFTEDDLLFLLS